MKLLQFLQYKKSVQDTSPSKDFSLHTLELKTGYTHSRGNMGSVLQICFFTGFDFFKGYVKYDNKDANCLCIISCQEGRKGGLYPQKWMS